MTSALAVATMLAAMLVVSVASMRPKSEMQMADVDSILPSSCTGSTTGAP